MNSNDEQDVDSSVGGRRSKETFKLKQAPEVVNGPAPAMGQGHGLFESCPIPVVRAARY